MTASGGSNGSMRRQRRLTRCGAPAVGRAPALVVAVALACVLGPGAQAASAGLWLVHSAPLPAGARSAELFSVSCPSATTCTAVGDWSRQPDPISTDERALIERYDRGRWTLQTAPALLGGTTLEAVSCGSARACTAVGQRVTDVTELTVAEHFDGLRWTLQPTPTAAENLTGVSCPTDQQCIAVGTDSEKPVAEQWDGRRWRVQPMSYTSPQGAVSGLTAVTCRSTMLCAAVGADDVGVCGSYFTDAFVPIVGFWKAERWSLTRTPDLTCQRGSHNEGLNSVACASLAACTAVGNDTDCSGIVGEPCEQLVERWNGRRWKVQPAPFIKGSELEGVACPAKTTCTAVGAIAAQRVATAERSALLIEGWNGLTWTRETAPLPADAQFAILHGVSCPSPNVCVAVGITGNDPTDVGPHHPLIEATG